MKELNSNWKKYLEEQVKLHPSMQPQDVYKMIFQAVFGAEHLLQNEEVAWTWFEKEYKEAKSTDEPLYEYISEHVCRVNLGAWKRENLSAQWLFRMFVNSVNLVFGQEHLHECITDKNTELKFAEFKQYEQIASAVVHDGYFAFSEEDFSEYAKSYWQDNRQEKMYPVHHSKHYRETESPCYRLVDIGYLRLVPILKKIMAVCDNAPVTILAIDGRCASGKTTMAQMLSELTGAGAVHMDDFFLPPEIRTRDRLEQAGGNVHYERFAKEVLPNLRNPEAFTYRKFDCSKMQLGDDCIVQGVDIQGVNMQECKNEQSGKKTQLRIVEGAYSTHPIFGEYADIRVFSDIDERKQLERILHRDGEEMLNRFQERWIPMEEKYFEEYQIRTQADVVV